MNILGEKFKDVLSSVLPIVLIIILLNFTITPLGDDLLKRFIVGSILIIIGLTIFLFGVDISIHPLGVELGKLLTNTGRIKLIAVLGFILGFFISAAEPDLHILAQEVSEVSGGVMNKFLIVGVVSIGIGALLSFGMVRIIKSYGMKGTFMALYVLIGILAIFSTNDYIAIAFDASGATTGSMSTPFILALAAGVSFFKGSDKNNEEDSFGLVGMCSAGAIIVVLILGIVTGNKELSGSNVSQMANITGVLNSIKFHFLDVNRDIFISIAPLIAIFIYKRKDFGTDEEYKRKIAIGFFYTYIGLVMFMLGVDIGFIEAGKKVGYEMAKFSQFFTVIVGFLIGLVVILAEPAVYSLTRQVEDITAGSIRRKIILITLSLGIGIAVSLSMLRIIIPPIKLWHYLLPGYALSLIMMRYTDNLFVGIAFDSGGVASGPMTATFVLGFATGVAEAVPGANVLTDGFGIIATVAMMAVFSLIILGMIFNSKTGGVNNG
ncbi:MAG: DUF1538 domain-containing protein [Tissierellia bacterium]|nr:DUF1538 domain-containing protein [Tissierellia bacterium]